MTNPFDFESFRQQPLSRDEAEAKIREEREEQSARQRERLGYPSNERPKLTPEQDEAAKKVARDLLTELRKKLDKAKPTPTAVTVVRPEVDWQETSVLLVANVVGTYIAVRKLARLTGMSKRDAFAWIVVVRAVLSPMSQGYYAWTKKS